MGNYDERTTGLAPLSVNNLATPRSSLSDTRIYGPAISMGDACAAFCMGSGVTGRGARQTNSAALVERSTGVNLTYRLGGLPGRYASGRVVGSCFQAPARNIGRLIDPWLHGDCVPHWLTTSPVAREMTSSRLRRSTIRRAIALANGLLRSPLVT